MSYDTKGKLRRTALLALIAAQVPLSATLRADTVKLGVLGDSNSDEYRADDNRGEAYAQVTLNWLEILVRRRDVDAGEWGTRNEPRRTGYAYNWARSGARASDLADQQSGLAQQVRDNEVEYAIIHIGSNDFHPNSNYRDIYDGSISGAALGRKITGIIADIRSAIAELTSAGAKVLVTSVPDAGAHPAYHSLYPDPAKRKIVTDAINSINEVLEADASADPSVGYADVGKFLQSMGTRLDSDGWLLVGDERIDFMNKGNEPHHLQLGDSAGHPGTIASALLANAVFIDGLNREFGTKLQPLTDQEVLCISGIDRGETCSGSKPKPPILSIAGLMRPQ